MDYGVSSLDFLSLKDFSWKNVLEARDSLNESITCLWLQAGCDYSDSFGGKKRGHILTHLDSMLSGTTGC